MEADSFAALIIQIKRALIVKRRLDLKTQHVCA